jgi:dihydrofolate synthase/folylpolyglutamate synthase
MNHLNLGKGTIIIGIPDDKDYLGVAMAMSEVSNRTILTKSQNPHYKFSEEQKAVVEKQGYKADWVPNLYKALKIAIDRNEPIVILGTTSVVAEVKKIQRNNWSQEM